MLTRPLLAVLLVLNVVVLMGQIWPDGAPPFARVVNVVFLLGSMAAFGYLVRRGKQALKE